MASGRVLRNVDEAARRMEGPGLGVAVIDVIGA